MTAFDNVARELTELDHRVERLETQDTALIAGGPGVSGAPSDAQYLVVGFSGDLSQERRLVSGNGMGVFVDGGANGDFSVVLGTPSTLSVSSANALTAASHTHAITSSSNPGAAASILATDASGYLQLLGLGIGTAAGANNRITMVDGGTIGQAAGPLLTFDDTSDLLEITGCKVGIGTTTVPHAGVGAALLALEGANGSVAAGPHIQITTAADNYPLLQLLNYLHDNIHIAFDAYYDGSWKSSDPGSSFAIAKTTDLLRFRYDVENAGDVLTWNEGLVLTTAGFFGANTTTPRDRVDILDTGTQLRLTHTDNTDYATFAVDGNGLMTVTTVDGGGAAGHIALMPDGNVGVGIAAPGAKQHLYENKTSVAVQRIVNIHADGFSGIEFMKKDNTTVGVYMGLHSDDTYVRMNSIDKPWSFLGGDVGFNTVAPRDRVDILDTGTQLRLTHTDNVDFATFAVDGNGLLTVTTVDGGGAAGHIALMPDGNVGVNTPHPDAPLDVLAASGVQMRLTQQDGVNYTTFESDAADDLIITTQGNGDVQLACDIFKTITPGGIAHTLWVDSGNDIVGVNTETPDATLEVLSTSTQLRLTHTDNTDYATFTVDGDGKTTIATVDGGGAAGHLILAPDGNVGIKEATPLAPVHITDTGASNTWDLTNEKTVVIEDDNCVLQMVGDDDSEAMVSIVMSNSTAASPRKNWVISHRGPDASNVFSVGYVTTAGAWGVATDTEYLTISTAGNVGLAGITAPLSPLHINLPEDDLEIVDADNAGVSTEQAWIEVEVGGIQGYLHVFAAE